MISEFVHFVYDVPYVCVDYVSRARGTPLKESIRLKERVLLLNSLFTASLENALNHKYRNLIERYGCNMSQVELTSG